MTGDRGALSTDVIASASWVARCRRAAKAASLAGLLPLAACASPNDASLHDRLYTFANAGWVRVGDQAHGKLDAASVFGIRECSVLLDPNARMPNGDYKVRMTLCRKPTTPSSEIASLPESD